jgi:murein DD-endopeptidase MepM/ murein hydrolase activator NlpD
MMFNSETNDAAAPQLDDTQPVTVSGRNSSHNWMGWICLVGAVVLTAASIVIMVVPVAVTPVERDWATALPTQIAAVPTSAAEIVGQQMPANLDTLQPTLLPTLSPEDAVRLLSTPPIAVTSNPMLIQRNVWDPFTFIPDRPRAEVIEYTAIAGDTIGGIAERFGLRRETIAWSNPRSYIQILQPGNTLDILPVDGIYHAVLVEETIASVASRYRVDPYTIIDSDYNALFGTTPETVLASGTRLVVPGGTGEEIAWSPQVVRVAASGGSGNSSSGGQISFSPGDPGSCGLVDNPGGGGSWVRPINGYTWIRGYASWHPAADLAISEGSPVYAANSGRVIFAGWNSFGYGYAVVIAHGPFTTIYAHLSAVSVGCGQDVAAGQQIASSGNTGNSSGPHLHFELRYNDIPQDPTYTVAL